ncbi:MAG: PAS domain-containing sensor histidine kinase [Leptospiraceae bacterium]|nr:PAS domain-containing sensor histidine kinase [Leptospiraceae bacterium]MBP9163434.1 PAS domain-containing sensor histidine kinase [Leptospiraceae bacterium]
MKQTEIALKESEKHYSRISETVPIILYDYILYPDGSNKFLYIGPTCREILEIDDKELLSNMNLFWQMVHPDDLQHLKDEDIKANKSRDLFMFEFRIITPSGRLKWIQLSSRPNSDSEIWSGYILDITERKNAELIIQKQNVQLTELNATKDKFFNIIAHDLRNPFAGILGISELMENILLEDNGEKPERLIELTKMIKKSSESALELISNLTDWAKSQTGGISINPTNLTMQYMFSSAFQIVNGNALKKNITIEKRFADNDTVYADNMLVNTILRNLLTNAIKFTHPNGKITVSALMKDDFLEISVTDTGVGIDPKNIPKIFKIDSKFSLPGTNKEKGTGLGLVLCKEFVEKQGGTIWVESELGKGSKFTFTLPKGR